MRAPKLIQMGVFGAPQGVRGEVRVKAFTASPTMIGDYGALTDETGARAFKLKVVRALRDDMVVARVEGIATREAAASLTHVGLYAARENLPPPAEGEYYHADLIGLAAVTLEGEALGEVAAVLNYGAGDILEIAPPEGETLLIPFSAATAPHVDFAAGRIVVVPPVVVEGEE